MFLFPSKRVLFEFYEGAFRGHSSNSSVPQNVIQKKFCLGGKTG